MTNAESRFNNSLRPRKPEGSLGRTAQDGYLDSHTAPELRAASMAVKGLSVYRYLPALIKAETTIRLHSQLSGTSSSISHCRVSY